MPELPLMSRFEVDEIVLIEISKACNVSLQQIEDVYACTPLQVAIVAESAIHNGASVFQFILALSPSVNLDRFCAALQHVVSLNAVLRTRIVDCLHGLVQVVTDERHRTKRLSGDIDQYLARDKKEALDLGVPLFRSAVLDRKLVLTMHHGIMDHASLTPLFRDVLNVYYGRAPEKRAEFKDFVAHCLGIDQAMARTFWESRFKGAPEIYPKVDQGIVPLANRIATQRIVLNQIGRQISIAHVPSFIETAWALTASIYTGNESVAFGLILSGRTSSVCPAAESTLGPTIAVLPVQVNLQRNTTIEEVLKDRSAARRQLQTHPALQYGLTNIRTLGEAARIASGFQTLLNIRPRWYDPNESSDIAYDHMEEPHGAFALSLSCDLEDTGVLVEAVYDPAVFCESQLDRVLHQFEHFLQSLMEASPQTKLERLPRLNPHDLSEIIRWNSTDLPQTEERCVHDLFGDKSRQQPKALAIDSWDGRVTYGELDELSNHLAHELRRRGVSTGSPVAFIFEKSLWAIVSLLGIMKAGGMCVPISVSDPPARKAAIISAAGVKIVITSSIEYANAIDFAPDVFAVTAASISGLPDNTSPIEVENLAISPEALAYILFTSGSTGEPKGVMLEHRCLASSLTQLVQRFSWKSNCRMLQFASYVWDASIGEIFCALLSGACLCIPSEEARESNLAGYIESTNVNCAWLTPTVLRTLSPAHVPTLRTLLSIGEAISPEASKTWGKALRFINGWGPCESSILSAVEELTPESPYPESIGGPINCKIWIVNPRNTSELVPIGAVGEILIDGPGVARGYLNDEFKTKRAFIQPPGWATSGLEKARHFYRTGDLAKYNADGSICFVGRKDNQIKIRGQRFELGELESVLSACDEVRDIFATTKIRDGRTELVAVICLADTRLPRETILQELSDGCAQHMARGLHNIEDYARSRLPSYMVPTIWLAVEKMPQTASAKLDRASISQWLKTKDLSLARVTLDSAMSVTLTTPCTEEEKVLQSAWQSALAIPKDSIGRESYFVRLGGDSILAMQAVGHCRERGLIITTSSLLRNINLATIAESSLKVESTDGQAAALSTSLSARTGSDTERMETILQDIKDHVPQIGKFEQHSKNNNVAAIVPATEGQATMLAVGETGGRGYYIDFMLSFQPTLDLPRLRRACEQVFQRHSILRTVFVRHYSKLYQVILHSFPQNIMVQEVEEFRRTLSFREGFPLARFHLLPDGQTHCQSLYLEIHHALYDAISLGLVFEDLDAAYSGRPLSDGPQFHSWISHIEDIDDSAPRKYWEEVLQGASMPYLVPPVKGAIRGHPLDDRVRILVPLQKLETPFGTPSTAVKAAWSLLISHALGTPDVVFGEVSANRYLTLMGIERVKGPCVNMVPVRSRLDPKMTLAALVAQIQVASTTGMPYHHLGTRSIVRDCTPWPRWTRFSTAIVYQNHDSVKEAVRICDSNSTPGSGNLTIELRFSSSTFPHEQIQWIAQTFSKLLDLFPSSLERSLSQLQTILQSATGSYVVPSCPSSAPGDLNGQSSSPSSWAWGIVSQAWKELEMRPNGEDECTSLWDCGGDDLTPLLLSGYYRSCGSDISAEDIVHNPSRMMQARLADLKKLEFNQTKVSSNEVMIKDGMATLIAT
ncbi:Fc.00g033890.m01.CDS01 [Cosmosporella sp. VM-42]